MKVSMHHAHLFASNLDESLLFYREMFGAEVIFDLVMAGARNVMISIGTGKINFYDQAPKDQARGVVHHLGIETDNLEALVTHMESKGYKFRNSVKNFSVWKYIMAEGPDQVLLEIFEVGKKKHSNNQFDAISSLKKEVGVKNE